MPRYQPVHLKLAKIAKLLDLNQDLQEMKIKNHEVSGNGNLRNPREMAQLYVRT